MQPNTQHTDRDQTRLSVVVDLTGSDDPTSSSAGADLTPPTGVRPHSTRELLSTLIHARPAWILLLAGDVAGLLAPASVANHGRVELLGTAALTLLLFQSGGLYRAKLKLSALDDAPRLLVRSLAAMLLIGGFTAVIGYSPVLNEFFVIGAAAVVLQLVARFVSYGLVRRARAAGHASHRALIIGGGDIASRISNRLTTDKTYGLKPVGFLDRHGASAPMAGLPFCGPTRALSQCMLDADANVLIVAFGDESDPEIIAALRNSELSDCEVFVVPRLFEIHNYGQTDHIGAIPVVRLPRRSLKRSSRLVKRAIDVMVSSIAIVFASPVMIAAAIAVRIESGPGVIFRQMRVGRGGREFELMKFRSLKPLDDAESATRWNVADEDRMGPVGRILRQTSIDELPQLFNILRGDMTLVGPRPERPHFAHTFAQEVPEYIDRHRMPVGLTGLAQVSGLRGDTSIADRARYDNFYIDNWTLWMDIKIMCDTVREVVGARGR